MDEKGRSKTRGERSRIEMRGKILGMWKAGKRIYEICEELGCSRSTAKRWIDRSVKLKLRIYF